MTRFYVDGSLDVIRPWRRRAVYHSCKIKIGDGVIIVTNFGLAVTHKTGAILDLSHSEISSIEDAKDGRLCIKWIESSGHEGSLDITTKGSDGAYERISAVRKQSEKKHSKVDNSLDHETAHSKIRSNKVPASVPDEFVWHDCWYDAARRLYVTVNPYFVQDQDLRKRSHQIEYQDQSGDHEGIVAKKEKIRMIVGFPSVQITKKGKCFYMLLPSLTREMVTADIAAARHAPAADQPRIDYFLSE